MPRLPCTHIRKKKKGGGGYIEKNLLRVQTRQLATCTTLHIGNLSFKLCFFSPFLLRLGAEERWGGGREGWAGSMHPPENTRSHFQAGSRLGAQRVQESRGMGGPIPPPSAPSRPPPPSTMEPGSRPALHPRLPPLPSSSAAHSGSAAPVGGE